MWWFSNHCQVLPDSPFAVIPAKAGIQLKVEALRQVESWTPAFAGVTELVVGVQT
jgi:hypothetical protein